MMADLSPLGKKSTYVDEYDNSLIFPIKRATKRKEIGINKKTPPFYGYDIFNAYDQYLPIFLVHPFRSI